MSSRRRKQGVSPPVAADVWAFGAVVYEMLTGHRAFPGQDVSETLAWVLAKEPVWEDLPQETPPALRQVLRLCLTKDANLRVRDMADVRLAISGAFGTSAVEQVGPHATRRQPSRGLLAHFERIVVLGQFSWQLDVLCDNVVGHVAGRRQK